MATSDVHVMAKRVKGGSFLTEERDPQDVFTPEDLSQEHRQIAHPLDYAVEVFSRCRISPMKILQDHQQHLPGRKAGKPGLERAERPDLELLSREIERFMTTCRGN